uniref:Uncharacterized protein n=1 Tax=Gadus morhua TaxID=8049 RepID=A0A8C4ZY28_GADMO
KIWLFTTHTVKSSGRHGGSHAKIKSSHYFKLCHKESDFSLKDAIKLQTLNSICLLGMVLAWELYLLARDGASECEREQPFST